MDGTFLKNIEKMNSKMQGKLLRFMRRKNFIELVVCFT